MSEDGELWAAHRKYVQERKQSRRQKGMCEIDDFCAEHRLDFNPINEYQVRIFGEKHRVDVYPTNKKYCILGAVPKWGSYRKIEDLSKHLF